MYRFIILSLFFFTLCAVDIAPPTRSPFGQISVSGSARIMVVPDEIILSLAAEAVEKDLQLAKTSTDAGIQAVRAAAKELGITDNKVQTDTIDIQVEWRNKSSADSFGADKRYFTVRRGITVCLSRADQVDSLMTKALAGGITTVNSIDFRTTKLREHREAARLQAVVAAREKATAMAKALGVELGHPTSVGEGNSGWYWGGFNRQQRRGDYQNVTQSSSGGGDDSGNIAPGSIAVDASVQVTFQLQ
ncbi:MAG: SIMPL domain-containing protein [Planctomycetota bacterium]